MRLFTEARIEDLVHRSRTQEFAPACDRLRTEIRELDRMGLDIPKESAGYFHEYFCPEHAVPLTWDPKSPGAHPCPVDGRVFSGEPFDTAWRWPVNTHLSRGAFKSALLWHIDGDEAHRRRAEDILSRYARRYDSYVVRRRGMKLQGRCCYHSLDEAVWLIPLTQAFDLIRDSLRPALRRRVADQLLMPAMEQIRSQQLKQIHNIECWHHAAIGAVGVCLDRPDLVRLAVDSRYSFRRQLEEGVRPDGFWFEGSTSYHFYTMAALISLASTMESAGMALHREERLKRMFRAPAACAYPDLRMPAMNDCWYFTTLLGECCHNTPDAAGFYEVGRAWYGEEFAWILAENYRRIKRDSLEALLYGSQQAAGTSKPKDSVPHASRLIPHSSCIFPDSGYAVLRTERPPTYLLLKYGPHGGGHGHPDKLSLILHACGHPVSPDLGTPGYGIGLNRTWYRATISHNTVLIDGLSQPPGTGRLNRFESPGSDGYHSADASVSWDEGAYAGVRMRRVILMRVADESRPSPTPSLSRRERERATGDSPTQRGRVRSSALYFIDLFSVTCDRPRQIDWVFRVKGRRKRRGAMAEGDGGPSLSPCPSPLEGEGYAHILRPTAGTVGEGARLSWRIGPRAGLDLFLTGKSDLVVGEAPFSPASELTDLVLARRMARTTLFASVISPYRGPRGFVSGVRVITPDPGFPNAIRLVVETAAGEEPWFISLR